MGRSLKPIDEQVIVITGATSGIGLATTLLAAESGAKLVLAARTQSTLNDLVEHVQALGGKAVAVQTDVASPDDMRDVADAAIENFGRIDTWINDAGVSLYARLLESTDADNRRLFDTNFWGVVYGTQAAMPYLKESEGALINLGSEVSEAVIPLQGMYSASKHAVKGFTDALRIEFEHDEVPVSVTLIQPGATDTPFPQHARNYLEKEPKLPTPLDDPFDVAKAILDAATHEKRSIKVSALSKLNTTMAKFAPQLADRMAVKQMDRQTLDESPINPAGALHRPGPPTGRVHGTESHRRDVSA
jgi:short-subunit dehydrogenase